MIPVTEAGGRAGIVFSADRPINGPYPVWVKGGRTGVPVACLLCSQVRTSEIAEALSVWCQDWLACVRARCRRRTQRGASYRNRAGGLGKWRKSWRKNWREYFSRRLDDPRARIWTWDAGSRRRWDAGSRQRRRHWIPQRAHLRRQQGELTGYSFQIRLLGCGALRERH